jgi:hypothetical protein
VTAFQKRLIIHWGEALSLYETILLWAGRAGDDFHRAHAQRAGKEHDLVFEALARLQARACLVGAEVLHLLKGGYPHGALARCRTLHELAVFATVIEEHGQDVAERFLLHQGVEDAENAEVFQKYAKQLGERPFSEARMVNIRGHRDALLRRYGKGFRGRYGWAAELFPSNKPPTFGDLEKLANLGHLRPYYDWSTHVGVHASSKGARLNLVPAPGRRGSVRLTGPTNAWLADPGQQALISLGQVTVKVLGQPGRQTGDPMPLIMATALLDLTNEAGFAFLRAHRRLEADEKANRRKTTNKKSTAKKRKTVRPHREADQKQGRRRSRD